MVRVSFSERRTFGTGEQCSDVEAVGVVRKPNGYRSIHLCVRLRELGVLAEIQVRTIAMDFWATLEHQLKYKKSIPCEGLIRSELKRCADEIASADLSMQTIREIIKQM